MIADRSIRGMEGPRLEGSLSRSNDTTETRERPPASAFGETIAQASRAAAQHSAQRALSAAQSRPHSGTAPGERDRAGDRESGVHSSKPHARDRETRAHGDEPRARDDESRRRDAQPGTHGEESRAGNDESRARGRRALAKDESARTDERPEGNPLVAPPLPTADSPTLQGFGGGVGAGLASEPATSHDDDASGEPDGELAVLPGAAAGDRSTAVGPRVEGMGAKPMAASSRVAPLQSADTADPDLQPDALKAGTGDHTAAAASETPGASNQGLSEFSARLAQIGAAAGSGGHGIGGLASAMPAAAPPIHVGAIAAPVGDPGFPGQLAGGATSLVIAGIENAEITLQPRELGPVKIEISLNGESASIAFSATQPDTRQAIEQSLPILKDMLAEHGLLLSDASVSDGRTGAGDGRSGQGSESRANSTSRLPDGRGSGSGTSGVFGDLRRPGDNRRGLLDLYA